MFSPPDDPREVALMRHAYRRSATALTVLPDDGTEVWGWRGRTLSGPVTGDHGLGWLRLVRAPADKAGGRLWLGPEDAEKAIPDSVPRPRLRGVEDWVNGDHAFRAELHDRVTARPITAVGPVLREDPGLDDTWWHDLRRALDDIASVTTDRVALRQAYVDRAMPEYLGRPVDTTVPAWTTAHGDLHWANLTAPRLAILDWEGWGTAPAGYDAAMLHTYSLLVPDVAARIRSELAHVLNTPAGRFSELAVITQLLQTTTRGDNLDLEQPLRARASRILGT
ncbi:hypothetical protein ACIRL2_23655 [Embleya sp. NPDC127516]|uniref:hypothetical protein n=1 Tax=Embleya sp. NPDC127516 TaxID=3363990 RepID=UPI0037FF7BAB